MKKVFALLWLCIVPLLSFAQGDISGEWVTIDDNSGKQRSIVEIYKTGNKYFGKVIKLFREPGEDANPLCEDCDEDDTRFEQPVIGMEIIKELTKDGDEYNSGNILDPENGSVYKCSVWLENGDLKVRGYVAFFYRTQTWKKFEKKM